MLNLVRGLYVGWNGAATDPLRKTVRSLARRFGVVRKLACLHSRTEDHQLGIVNPLALQTRAQLIECLLYWRGLCDRMARMGRWHAHECSTVPHR
jgi:hypothetical protein